MEKNGLLDDESLLSLYKMTLFHKDMASFLSNLLLGTEGDIKRSGEKEYTSDAVTLMTLHGSKGLEFPVVFIAGTKQGKRRTDPSYKKRIFRISRGPAAEIYGKRDCRKKRAGDYSAVTV